MIETIIEPKSYEYVLLDPRRLRFSYSPEGTVRMEIEGERCYLGVEIQRSFPIDEQSHYLSVRNALNEELPEIGIIEDSRELDPESALIVERELYRRYFVPQVQRVYYLKEEFGVVNFTVDTDRGRREFSVRHPYENLRYIGEGRMLVVDIDGCRYEIPRLDDLDKKSVQTLRDYVDS